MKNLCRRLTITLFISDIPSGVVSLTENGIKRQRQSSETATNRSQGSQTRRGSGSKRNSGFRVAHQWLTKIFPLMLSSISGSTGSSKAVRAIRLIVMAAMTGAPQTFSRFLNEPSQLQCRHVDDCVSKSVLIQGAEFSTDSRRGRVISVASESSKRSWKSS